MLHSIKINISKNEFEKRFNEMIISEKSSIRFWEQSVFIGKLNKNRFCFYWKEAFVRNSFRTVIRGVITETQEGCNIEYKFDKFIFTKLFTYLMSTIGVVFGIIFLLDLQLIGLIHIGISLLPLMLIVFKTKKCKDALFMKLLEVADIKDCNEMGNCNKFF